jgi:hypothetical protein
MVTADPPIQCRCRAAVPAAFEKGRVAAASWQHPGSALEQSRFHAVYPEGFGADEMESEGAGSIWLFAVFGGPILLGLAILFGLRWQSRRRRSLERIGDAVTRENYAAENAREKRAEREPV